MEPLGPATCSPHVPGEGRPLMGEVRLPTRGAHPGSPRCHGPHGSVRTPSTPAVTALWFLYPWPWTRQAALGPRESLSSPQPQDHKNHGCKLNSLPVGAEPRAKQGGGRGAGAARSTTPRQGRRSRARSELSRETPDCVAPRRSVACPHPAPAPSAMRVLCQPTAPPVRTPWGWWRWRISTSIFIPSGDGARRARLKQQAAGQALRLFMGCRGLGVSSPCGLV